MAKADNTTSSSRRRARNRTAPTARLASAQVERSPTIFDSSLDYADQSAVFTKSGNEASPAQARALAAADYAVRAMRSKSSPLLQVRKYIASLDLTLPRLARLNSYSRLNSLKGAITLSSPDTDIKAGDVTWGEWRAGSRLVHRAATQMLLDVPARNSSDAIEIAKMVYRAPEPPPPAQQRRVAKRLARYFAVMLAGGVDMTGRKSRPRV